MIVETAGHLLVETKESGDAFLRDARALAGTGRDVTLLLIQDAAGAALRSRAAIARLTDAGVRVLIDDFSLRQHAVRAADLPTGLRIVDADDIADLLLTPGVKVVWH